jgi:hypothetical protein
MNKLIIFIIFHILMAELLVILSVICGCGLVEILIGYFTGWFGLLAWGLIIKYLDNE